MVGQESKVAFYHGRGLAEIKVEEGLFDAVGQLKIIVYSGRLNKGGQDESLS
jgi:hypothetical protein